jgi:hypothetical protein
MASSNSSCAYGTRPGKPAGALSPPAHMPAGVSRAKNIGTRRALPAPYT